MKSGQGRQSPAAQGTKNESMSRAKLAEFAEKDKIL